MPKLSGWGFVPRADHSAPLPLKFLPSRRPTGRPEPRNCERRIPPDQFKAPDRRSRRTGRQSVCRGLLDREGRFWSASCRGPERRLWRRGFHGGRGRAQTLHTVNLVGYMRLSRSICVISLVSASLALALGSPISMDFLFRIPVGSLSHQSWRAFDSHPLRPRACRDHRRGAPSATRWRFRQRIC